MIKHINRTGLVILLLLLSTSSVFAQSAVIEWENLNREFEELYCAGNYDRAMTVAKKALSVAEQNTGPDHPNVAESLNNLGELYNTKGDYAQAEPLIKRSLTIREKALGSNHPDVAESLHSLAELYQTQGHYAQV